MTFEELLAGLLEAFEVLERLRAIVAELGPGGDGPDVAATIAAGLLEELEEALEADDLPDAA